MKENFNKSCTDIQLKDIPYAFIPYIPYTLNQVK